MAAQVDRFLDRALKIRPGEGPRVALMAFYAANAIGAVVVGRTVRDTLFLTSGTWSKDDLPLMYILNSIAVAVLSWGYSQIADLMRRDRLNTLVAGGWAVVMALFYVAASFSQASIFAPVLYVAVEAMGALVVIQFWTFAQDVFNAREAKRLFGLIGAGGQAANVIYGFLAASVSKRWGAESLLLVCAANLLVCAFIAFQIGSRYATAAPSVVRSRISGQALARGPAGRKTGWRAMLTPHLIGIAGISILSALAVNLVDFQFKAAADASYQDKAALGAFFGRFYGICGAAALAIQMGLTGRILERFGILASLLPLPIGLAFGGIMAAVFPSGWAQSLAKGSDSIFRYTLNDASVQLLYVPVPAHLRGQAKAFIDGILKPAAGVLAGLILVVLGYKRQIGSTESGRADPLLTSLILALVIFWVFLLWRGRKQYVHSLLDTLQKRRLDLSTQTINADQATADALAKVLRSDDALAILNTLQLLPHVRGRDFGPLVAELLDHKFSSLRAAAADHLAENADRRYAAKLRERLLDKDPWCVASAISAVCALEHEKALTLVRPFLKDPRPAIRAAAVVGLVRHAGINGILESAEELKRLLNADLPVERELAASVLGAIGVPTFYESLLRFLEDPSPYVRRAALASAGKLKSPELVPHLVKLLPRTDTGRESAVALASFGPGVEQALGAAMTSPEFRPEARRAVPAVLGRIGTKEAADKLQLGLDSTDAVLRASSARALARLVRRRTDVTVRRDVVMKAIWSEIVQAEWLFDVQRALSLPLVDRNSPFDAGNSDRSQILLSLALREERERSIARALVLLELLHPTAALDVVSDNLRSDLPARRANAVEVLDNTIREDLKKRLIPLIEDRLQRPNPSTRETTAILADLIKGVHPWISACASLYACEHRVLGLGSAMQAALTSPVPYVREANASALVKLSPAEAKHFLEPLRADPSPAVRRVAEGAMVLAQLATG